MQKTYGRNSVPYGHDAPKVGFLICMKRRSRFHRAVASMAEPAPRRMLQCGTQRVDFNFVGPIHGNDMLLP